MNKKLKKIIIATGGTGGHVFPAYSLAKHFIDKNIHVQIISDKRGLRYLKAYNNLKVVEIASSTIFKKNILDSVSTVFPDLEITIKRIFFKLFLFLKFNIFS